MLLITSLLSGFAFAANNDWELDESIKVEGMAHIRSENDTDGEYVGNKYFQMGTTGESLRIEGLALDLKGEPEDMMIVYRAHARQHADIPKADDTDNVWKDPKTGELWKKADNYLGTKGDGLRLEGVQIRLINTKTNEDYEGYKVEYQVHMRYYGWGANQDDNWRNGKEDSWVSNGEYAGTKRESRRIEAVRLRIKRENDKNKETNKIVLAPEHTVDLEATTIDERYANAYHITVDQIAELCDYDDDIVVTTSADGITFTSTVSGETEGDKNRFVRLGYKDEAGCLDLTALEGISGKIGIDVYGDLDLTQTSNGFYVRVKQGSKEVGNYKRVSAGVDLHDTILETYMTNEADNVYIELTIPWQGSFTIKGIYLYMEDEVKGFADMKKKITGGQGATDENTYIVTNAAEFFDAIIAIRESGVPSIIYVDGTITYDDYWEIASGKRRSYIEIGANVENLSIIGVGTNGIFDGIGLKIQGKNTIIQNLTIRKVLAGDAIEINNAKYVWVDHCTLHNEPISENPHKDKYDELISIKNDAEYIILSWNHLYDSHKTILVGSNDEQDAQPDRKVIMHHNYIQNSSSRVPLYRGGHAHIYNNYYENIGGTGINCRTGSKVLIENNYFKNCKDPIGFWFDDHNPSGLWDVRNNKFDNCSGDILTTSTTTVKFEATYKYNLDPVEEIPDIIIDGAGVGKI